MANEKMNKVYEMIDTVYAESHGDREIRDMVVASIIDSIHHELHKEQIEAERKKNWKTEELLSKVDALLHAADNMIDSLGFPGKDGSRFLELFYSAVETFDKAMDVKEGK